MRDPLKRRVFREIRSEAGKYIVIFLFMVAIISVASGFFVADASLKKAYDDSFEKYNVEDGNFELFDKATSRIISSIEKENVTLYENFYKDEECVGGSKLRVFKVREEVNRICLLDGAMPENGSEIALDRLYMKSNSLSLGESVTVGGQDYDIVGIVALPDYSALYESPADFMFDTEKFGVGAVTESGFELLGDDHLHWSYSWIFKDPPAEKFGEEASERSEELMKAISKKAMLLNFIPACHSSAIRFAGNDIGHDRVMMLTMLIMLIVIVAFVFAVTTSNTISKEANVIGTLRASGYSRLELIFHYMSAPMLVLLTASVIGNILGYTLLKESMADMYLGSYSLVSYTTLSNAQAFIDTTVIPLLILAAINFVMLSVKLTLPPLKFLRRDLKRHQRKKAFKLNTKMPIMRRFRLRVLFQNIPGYITIFIGVFFASVVMVFALLFDPLLDYFEKDTENSMMAQHQYILKTPVGTDAADAEKFGAYDLKIKNGDFSEDVMVYGIEPDSRYCSARPADGEVEISSAYADKYSLRAGDTITLYEEFGDGEYEFTVSGIFDYPSSLTVFMDIAGFCDVFDLDEGYFSGYFSDEGIDDIHPAYIASEITKDDLTKTSRQLRRSMGNMMSIFLVLGVGVIILVVYLLAKVIIEKNTQSISVTKILGYDKREISGIYIRTTTAVTLLSLVLCVPLVHVSLVYIWRVMMMTYPGWLAPNVPAMSYVKTVLIGAASYIATALLLKRRIDRIPMDEALKNTE